MRRSIIKTFFVVSEICILCCFVQSSQAQVGLFVPKDERIAKFQKEILQYLVKQNQFRGVNDEITIENYQDRMIVRRCIEIYSDNSVNNILLIKFQANVDHCDKFWGVLTQKRSYLFYDFEDPQFQLLTKEINLRNLKIIKNYCLDNN